MSSDVLDFEMGKAALLTFKMDYDKICLAKMICWAMGGYHEFFVFWS